MTTEPLSPERLDELARKVRGRIVRAENNCWEWTGAKHSNGYGQVWCPATKRLWGTHRVMVLASGRDIPAGMQVDHLCRNPTCCNPDHLEVVTPGENTRRGMAGALNSARAARLSHCHAGHLRTPENTYTRKDGRKQCRVCSLAKQAARREARCAKGLTQHGQPRKWERP